MIVTVDLPQSLFKIRTGSFHLRSYRTTSASNWQPSVPRREGARDHLWSLEVESTALGREATIELEAWFAQLADQNWCFKTYDPLRQLPLGVGNGYADTNDEILFTTSPGGENLSFCTDFRILEGSTSALVKTEVARGSRSLVIKGLDTGLSGQTIVKKGDHVGIGLPGEMNLHMVTSNAVCDASGEARLNFIAPLWKRALPNDVINFDKPPARFVMLDDDNRIVREPGQLAQGVPIRAIEYPYQEPNP